MRRRRTWIAMSIICAFVGLPCIYSLLRIHTGQNKKTLTLTQVYNINPTVQTALDLSLMLQENIVLEGGTYGGILGSQARKDIMKDLPSAGSYNPETDCVLWAYNFEPKSIVFDQKYFGNQYVKLPLSDGYMKVLGESKHDNKIYYTVLPVALRVPGAYIRIVPEEDEQHD